MPAAGTKRGCSSAEAQHTDLLWCERQLWARGLSAVAGVDEVGRGPLAGPVVAVAVVFEPHHVPEGLRDSKALRARRREEIARLIETWPGVRIGLGSCEPELIDRLNILRATHEAMRRALLALDPPAQWAIVDGLPVPGLPVPSEALVKGDARCASVAAASIVAKVRRDRRMSELDATYPGYGFARHKGYATREHLQALRQLGPCPEHRRSFEPVARFYEKGPRQLEFAW